MLLAPPCVPPSVSSLTTEYLTPVSCGPLSAASRTATVTSASRITTIMHVSALGFMLAPLSFFRRRATARSVCPHFHFPDSRKTSGFRQTPPFGPPHRSPRATRVPRHRREALERIDRRRERKSLMRERADFGLL